MGKRKIIFVIERLGPYHKARLQSLVESFNVVVIEILQKDEEYRWDLVNKENDDITYYTLFKSAKDYSANFIDTKEKVELIIEAENPHSIFISGYNNLWALTVLKLSLTLGIKSCLMTESHEKDFTRYFIKEKIKTYILDCFDTAFVGGTKSKKYLQDLGFKQSCIEMYYDIVDNKYFEEKCTEVRRDKSKFREECNLPQNYILASSRFIKRKNLATLIEVFEMLTQNKSFSKYCLVILGDGEERASLQTLIDSKKLNERVSMPGFIQYQDLPVYYSFAEVFVHISYNEQWGLVVNEAMASSLPIIVSKECGCAVDLVIKDYNGFIVSAYDKIELFESLKLLLNDVEKRQLFASNSLKRISTTWSAENHCNSVTKLVSKTDSNKNISIINKLALNLFLILHYGKLYINK